jgi:hypothetical protein
VAVRRDDLVGRTVVVSACFWCRRRDGSRSKPSPRLQATADLAAGTVLWCERALAVVIDQPPQAEGLCHYCARPSWALVPCPTCDAYHCSAACAEASAQLQQHAVECGGAADGLSQRLGTGLFLALRLLLRILPLAQQRPPEDDLLAGWARDADAGLSEWGQAFLLQLQTHADGPAPAAPVQALGTAVSWLLQRAKATAWPPLLQLLQHDGTARPGPAQQQAVSASCHRCVHGC